MARTAPVGPNSGLCLRGFFLRMLGAVLVVPALLVLRCPSAFGWVDEPDDPLFRKDPLAGVEEQWNLMSDGRGIAVTEAWKLTHGDPRVVIANLDSGVDFRHEDLRNQFYLHAGELPLPLDADGIPSGEHDFNGDGIFNVFDYAHDGRVEDLEGDGVDVGDLLRAFSDGVDDDLNGYVDDVSGWDFFDNDNDASDAGDYGHGTQTSSIHSAETDNGVGMAGVAPRCRLLALRIGDAPHISHSQLLGEAAIYAADNGARVLSMSLGCMSNSPFLGSAFRYATDMGAVCVAAMGNEHSHHHNYPAAYDDVIGVGSVHPDTSGLPYPLFFPTSWVTRAHYSDYGGHIDLVAPSWVIAADYHDDADAARRVLCRGRSSRLRPTDSAGGLADRVAGRRGEQARSLARSSAAADGYQQHSGGTSNATPHVSGVAALVFSLAEELGIEPPLRPAEVRQILRRTAEDITGTAYDCRPGFDQWTGYGRLRADRAVSAVKRGEIPPVAVLRSPGWYATLDPRRTPLVPVQGFASAERAAGYTLEAAWALGVDPLEEDFRILYVSPLLTRPQEGELCSLDLGRLALPQPGRISSPHDPATTLRLRVTDTDGRQAEDRRTLFVHRDPSLHPGFPMDLGASIEGSVRLADLDGDNKQELIVVTSEGLLWVFREDGTLLDRVHGRKAEWPAALDPVEVLASRRPGAHGGAPAYRSGAVRTPRSPVVATPAVGDLDRDGITEIVVASTEGGVYVFGPDGARRPGFPVSVDPGFAEEDPWLEPRILSSPALADLDLDGLLEIVVGAMDQRVYVWRADGSPQPGWPALARDPVQGRAEKIVSSAAVGDLDGLPGPEGRRYPEVVVGSNELFGELPFMSARVHAFHHDGRMREGWPVALYTPMGEMLPTVGKGVSMNPLLADLQPGGGLEVVVSPVMGAPAVISGDGRILSTLPSGFFGKGSDSQEAMLLALPANAALGDLNRDGSPDLVMGGVGARIAIAQVFEGQNIAFDHLLGCWDLKGGRFLKAYPRVTDGFHFITQPVVADVSGDGLPEIVDGNSHYLLRAFSETGEEPEGWPKFTGGWIVGTPALGDLDGDGLLEVALGTREGNLYVWDTPGSALHQAPGWWTFHHDAQGTGNHHADAWPPDAIEDLALNETGRNGRNGILLTWSAVGDNGRQGRAAAYEIRRHERPIDLFNWPEAERVAASLTPAEAGAGEELFLEGVFRGAHFAVRAVDAAGNLSGLYPADAGRPLTAAGPSAAEGGCGCAVLGGGRGQGRLQPLVSALLYLLPTAWLLLLRKESTQMKSWHSRQGVSRCTLMNEALQILDIRPVAVACVGPNTQTARAICRRNTKVKERAAGA